MNRPVINGRDRFSSVSFLFFNGGSTNQKKKNEGGGGGGVGGGATVCLFGDLPGG